MKKQNTERVRVSASFGLETGFEVTPSLAGLARREKERELESLKARLLEEKMAEAWEPEVRRFLSSSASEAASVAWLTGYPLLVFPALFEEKTASALWRMDRQVEIRQRSRELLAV